MGNGGKLANAGRWANRLAGAVGLILLALDLYNDSRKWRKEWVLERIQKQSIASEFGPQGPLNPQGWQPVDWMLKRQSGGPCDETLFLHFNAGIDNVERKLRGSWYSEPEIRSETIRVRDRFSASYNSQNNVAGNDTITTLSSNYTRHIDEREENGVITTFADYERVSVDPTDTFSDFILEWDASSQEPRIPGRYVSYNPWGRQILTRVRYYPNRRETVERKQNLHFSFTIPPGAIPEGAKGWRIKPAWNELLDGLPAQTNTFSTYPVNCIPASPQPPTSPKGDDDMNQCRFNDTLLREILNELRNFNAMMRDEQNRSVGLPRKGLKGMVQNQEFIYNKTSDAVLVLPESWEMKSDAVRHLVVRWRNVKDNGELGDRYSSTVIPFYKYPESYKPAFTDRPSGGFYCVLPDIGSGANCIMFASSHEQASNSLIEAAQHIEDSRLPENWQQRFTKHFRYTAKPSETLRAFDIHFFEKGWKAKTSLKLADWSKSLL